MTTSTPQAELTRTVDGSVVPAPGIYDLDKAHTVIGFVARHLMVTKVRGTFGEFEGAVTVAEEPTQSSVEVEIRTDSVTTGEPQRDAHLRSADFFEQEKFPTMSFKSTSIVPAGDGNWEIAGDLTIRGVTKPVTLNTEFNGAATDPWGGFRLGFSAWTEVNRQDFGVSFGSALADGSVVVGDKVRIEIEAEAVRRS